MIPGRMPLRWLGHFLGLCPAYSGTTVAERQALARHAAGKKVLVEIGVDEGLNSLNMRRVMDPTAALYLVDPYPAGRMGVNFSRLIARREVNKDTRGSVTFVPVMGRKAASILSIEPDFIFIDGDHSYETVKQDWEDWSPKGIPGGIIALHDSCVFPGGKATEDSGPVRLLKELIEPGGRGLAAGFQLLEIVDSLSVLQRAP